MNLRSLKTKTLSEASAAALDAAFATWRDTLPNATMVSILYAYEGGQYTMLVVYTD